MLVSTWAVIISLDLNWNEFFQSTTRISHDWFCVAWECTKRLRALLFPWLKVKTSSSERGPQQQTCWQRGSLFMLAPTITIVEFYLYGPRLKWVLQINLLGISQNWVCRLWRVHMKAPNSSLWGAIQPEVEPQLQWCGCRPNWSRNLDQHTTFL